MALIPNFYQSKNYKLLIIVPLLFMLISLYFIPRIQLDSTLKGGIQIQLQTNSTLSPTAITAQINSAIPGAQTSVEAATSGLTITLDANTSLTNAQNNLTQIVQLEGNYSQASIQVEQYQTQLKNQPTNASIRPLLSAAEANQTLYLSTMASVISDELTSLKPLLNSSQTYSYNASKPASIATVAQSATSAAEANYKNFVVNAIRNVVPFASYSYNDVTPTLGSFFLSQMLEVIISAFILVAIAVFFVFRTPLPAFTVVFGAANDIIVALGAMGLFGIPLGIASIGGLLMLIGYAIDTDLLSSIRIIKRGEGTPEERAFATMKTGVTMTSTAIISFGILFIVAYVAFIPTYFEIAGVVLAGLFAYIFTTWLGNTPMILWYKLRKEVRP